MNTSLDAYDSVKPSISSIRDKIAELVKKSDTGMTCDEAEVILNLRHQTCSARFRELVDLKLIINSGKVRKTRSGRNARIYISTKIDI